MRVLQLFAILLTSLAATAQLKATWNGANTPGKPLMIKILGAWSTLDPDNAAPFYDKSAKNVFFDVAPLQYRGWADYEAGSKLSLGEFASLNGTLHSDSVQVHVSSATAWATGIVTLDGKLKNGNRLNFDGRWTVIWEHKGSKWLIVHEHLSAPWSPDTESRQGNPAP
jgi:ketosteroid isomerase-like protein